MKTYIRRQQQKYLKHQDIKQKEPPQKYRLGTISNTKLLAGINRFYIPITFYIHLKQKPVLSESQLTNCEECVLA